MDKESLKIVRDFIMNIEKLNIPIEDKVELLINLNNLLDPDNYYRDITILQRYDKKEKWRK